MNKRLLVVLPFLMLFNILKAQSTFLQNRVVAHRGAWKAANLPQNSIASLNQAIKLGCEGSEFDIRMTKDEVLVINHDAEYQGMDIEKTNYKDLLKKPLKNGEPIPTFKDYLKAGKKQKKTRLVAEIKPSPAGKEHSVLIAEKVVKMVQKMKMQDWVVYISFEYDILKKIVELDKNAKTQYLNGEISAEQLKKDGISGADYHFSIFQKDENWLANAHKTGIVTNAWTVNDTLVMDYLLVRNIDYLTTDEPEKALVRVQNIPKNRPWQLVWSDEFNYYGVPNSMKWGYDVGGSGWGNNEKQFYTEGDTNNAIVKNGLLNIIARKEKKENMDYTSTRLISKGKGDWLYGRIEVRAKIPGGRGMWPAIWMLPTDWAYGGWPASGEIDMMENVGYNPDSVFFTAHTKSFNHMIGTQKSNGIVVKDAYTAFHSYNIEWDKDKIDFYIDNTLVLTFKNTGKNSDEWPFDKRFHLLLNIAVGGNWGGQKGIDDNAFPATMQVDYVRVFQKN